MFSCLLCHFGKHAEHTYMTTRSLVVRRSSERFGFTLVELLVAIALIALMIAILLPVLGRAREAAYAVQCNSQQRQIGIAIHTYSYDDRKTALPNTERWAAVWMIMVSPYIGHEGVTTFNNGYSQKRTDDLKLRGFHGSADSVDTRYPVFDCPGNAKQPAGIYYAGTYGYNLTISSPDQGSGSTSASAKAIRLLKQRTMDSLKSVPSNLYLIGDNGQYSTEGWSQATSAANPLSARPRHHDQKINILFADSHSERLGPGDRRDLRMEDSPRRSSLSGALITGDAPDGWF